MPAAYTTSLRLGGILTPLSIQFLNLDLASFTVSGTLHKTADSSTSERINLKYQKPNSSLKTWKMR